GLLDVDRDERGSAAVGAVRGEHEQQKLRGAPGRRRSHVPGKSAHRGCRSRHGVRHRRADVDVIMQPFTQLSARAALLLVDDVDTDQIIPARFLTTTTRAGLGAHLFADWRFDTSGNTRPDFALNQPEFAGARILVAGRNFGCGSSREHAPWALLDYGFTAVIAT